MPLSRSPSRAATGSSTRSEATRTRPSVAAAASSAGRSAAATSILPTGELFSASTTSAEITRTMSPLTSPDSPAATAEAAPGGSGTVSGSLTGLPGTSSTVAGTSDGRRAGGRDDHRGDGLGVLGRVGAGGGHAVSFAAAYGVGTMAAASRRRWLLAIA